MRKFVFCFVYILIAEFPCHAEKPTEPTQRKAGDVILEPASLNVKGHGKVTFEFGTLFVPENRAEKNTRVIGVGFARFKATTTTDTPPIFLLPGGPAGSYLDGLDPDNFRASFVERILRYRAIADVVIVDQRGFSKRGDVLTYRFQTQAEPLDQPASLKRSTLAFVEMARAAVKEYQTKDIDLRGYTVKECADDVNDLRKALDYKQITLVGNSFGSQWSFAILRRHPERVARALLSGVEPLDFAYDMPSHVLAAMHRMWRDAEKDERLRPYLPKGGLPAAARAVVKRLEREPIRVTLQGVKNVKTGEPVSVVLGVEDFQQARVLRSDEGPAFVLSLYHEQYNQWAFVTNLARRSRPGRYPLIAGLIDTSLGVTPQRGYLLRNDPGSTMLGHWNFDSYLASAEIWPSPDVGDAFRTEVVCETPIVFVQGNWDTQTPVENVLQVAPYYRKGHVLLVERGGHGVMGQLLEHAPKTVDALLGFLETGDATTLPTRIAVPAPKFRVPSFSPPKP